VKIGSTEIRNKKKDTEVQRKMLSSAIGQLADYFGGRLKRFRIKRDYSGLTKFEKKVLRVLDRISCGKTSSYQEIARQIGKPKAARAVGNAVGKNPFSLITPCHRVIKSDGTLGGFGAGPSISTRNL
jgi:methylated-DNA-[protein]-cysteine S-methyltransferase